MEPLRAGHPLLQRVLGDLLHAEVEGELDVVPGLGRRVAEHLHEAPAAVDLEPAGPRHAAQLRLEELLDTLLADLVALSVALALVDLAARPC